MLSYHPALDPYHSALRSLRILIRSPLGGLQSPQLQVMEFLLLFPDQIAELQLPRQLMRYRGALRARRNPYWLSASAASAYRRCELVHHLGLQMLRGSGFVDETTPAGQRVSLVVGVESTPMGQLARTLNEAEEELMRVLVDGIGGVQWTGRQGLRERIGFLGALRG